MAKCYKCKREIGAQHATEGGEAVCIACRTIDDDKTCFNCAHLLTPAEQWLGDTCWRCEPLSEQEKTMVLAAGGEVS